MNFHENSELVSTASERPIVSVVVLAYSNRQFVDRCLETVAAQTWPNLEVLFVDNASADDSAAVARAAISRFGLNGRVMELPSNLGCAGGNNVGWRASHGEVLLFLNPDTELEPDCIEQLVQPLISDPTIGATGAKMYFPGGKILQHAGGIVHPNGMTNHHGAGEEDHGQCDQIRQVDYVTGAALAMRRTVMEEIGGFDEDYFPAYYEEVDLCLRIRRAGYQIVFIPAAVLIHHESVSVGKQSRTLHRLFPRMRIRYLLKNLTLRQLAGWAVPFEFRWMRYEPKARGYRWYQLQHGWIENLPWVAAWLMRGKRRPGVHKGTSTR